jgi:HAD superfamily hydrolase (TIGR01509 family)
MSAPGLVVFDCDGVLVDTERLTVAVEARLLTDLGNPHTPEQVVARWMGRTSAAQLAELAEEMGHEAAGEFDRRATTAVHEAFERELREVEGVATLLDGLDRAGIPVCVASSGTHERMRHTLGLTGLLERFSGRVFSATEVEHGKPAPDLFLHAARSMGVPPERCVVIEDSVYGVRAGVAAGMRVYGFAGGLAPAAALKQAGAVLFDSMPDLLRVLVD